MTTTRRRLLARRRVALAVGLMALSLSLAVDGFIRHQVGRSATDAHGPSVPALPGAGPIVEYANGLPRSPTLPDRTIALTFDDGPDPQWTPRILEVLRRHRVPATFFVVGAAAAAHPGIVRGAHAAGHEIGAHTFTHVDVGTVPRWRGTVELTLTQTALAGAAGINTRLFRLPYSSTVDALAMRDAPAAQRVGELGYVLAFTTEDGEDWRRPGPAVIAARSTPAGDRGGIVLLHDGGGDRSQTVEALNRLIPTLLDRGYRFTTVSGIAGLDGAAMVHPAGFVARLQGRGLLAGLWVASTVARLFTLLLFLVGILAIARGVILVALARRQVNRPLWSAVPGFAPPVSIIVPAYNEEVGIAAAVASLAASDYPDFEILVVDDGSTDRTAEVVGAIEDPRVRLLRQRNAGKPAALNHGIAHARHDIVVMVDGDTIFEPDTVRQLVAPLADQRVGAVSGNTKVGEPPRPPRPLAAHRVRHGVQPRPPHVRRARAACRPCRAPSAPSAGKPCSRSAASATTPSPRTPTSRWPFNRAGWRVVYEERARAWTEAPSTLGQLWRQRYRWCYGTLQAMWKHRRALVARDRSRSAVVGLPYLVLFQVVAAAARPGHRPLRALRPAVPRPEAVAALLARLLSAPDRPGRLRLPPRPRTAPAAVDRAAAATRLPPAHVPGRASNRSPPPCPACRLRWHKLQRTGAVTVSVAAAGVEPAGAGGDSQPTGVSSGGGACSGSRVRRAGPGQQEALHGVAAQAVQRLELVEVLDPFGHHARAAAPGPG